MSECGAGAVHVKKTLSSMVCEVGWEGKLPVSVYLFWVYQNPEVRT